NYTENKLRYNGGSEMQNKEFSDGSGLEMYETSFRGYDAQIGRFGQIDPMAGSSLDFSPYAYVDNNPVLYNDPSGLRKILPISIFNAFSLLDQRQQGGGGGGGFSLGGSHDNGWGMSMGNVQTGFDQWVAAANQQADQAVAGANFVNELNNFTNAMPDNSIRTLVNNNDGSWQMTGANDVISASMKTDGNGNMKLTYNYNYSDPTAGVPDGQLQQVNTYVVHGTIKMYGDFDNGGGGQAQGGGWYEPATKIAYSAGVVAEGMKDFGKAARIIQVGKAGGGALFGIGLIFDAKGVYNYYNDGPDKPNSVSPGKAAVNTGFAVYGFWNPVVGMIYGGVDVFYPGGWNGVADDWSDYTDEHPEAESQMISNSFSIMH
ncbi:MAG: RHS repeat-associated core domain-containing protein, partial [Bacteroidota bacterium]|nr:RHS repeat-associated core domain-containing protein [Bacteroidota bacterium]